MTNENNSKTIYKYLTRGRRIDGKVFDLYDTAKNPFEAQQAVKKAKKNGYKYHRVLPKKRWLEVWVRK